MLDRRAADVPDGRPDRRRRAAPHGRLNLARCATAWEQVFLSGGMRVAWPIALGTAGLAAQQPRKPAGLADLLRMLTRYVPEVPDPTLPAAITALPREGLHQEPCRGQTPRRSPGGTVTDTAYIAPSTLDTSGRPELSLATALGRTPSGDVWHPTFFTGFVARPDVAAAAMLAVADVAATRYADLGLAKRLANLDPVVTASGDRLRFESFSQCNGVHARFDLEPDGIDAGEVGFGTTNVDINPPLRAALASVPRGELLHLSVGSDALRVATPDTAHEERKVRCPTAGCAASPRPRCWPGPPSRCWSCTDARSPRSSACCRGTRAVPGRSCTSCPGRAASASSPTPWPARCRCPAHGARVGSPHRSVRDADDGLVVTQGHHRLALRGTRGRAHPAADAGGLPRVLRRGQPAGAAHPPRCRVGGPVPAHPPRVGAPGRPRRAGRGLGTRTVPGRRRPRLAVGLGAAGLRHHGRRLVPPGAPGRLRPDRARQPSAAIGPQDHRIEPEGDGWRMPGQPEHGWPTVRHVRHDGDRWVCTCPWEQEHHGTRGPCKHVLAVALAQQADT